MKIICIGPAYPLRGGIADFNEQLCKTLISFNHSVQIISYSLQYPSILFPGKTQYSNSAKPENLDIRSTINSINPITWHTTAKYCIQQKPDICIIHYWMPFFAPALGTIIKKIKKELPHTKIIGICHNLIPHEQRPGDTFLTKYFTKQCDSFIAMSASVATDLHSIAPHKKVVVTPHPIYSNFGSIISKSEACKKLHLNPATNYILFFGLVRKYKGLDLLLESLSHLSMHSLNCKLLIAGEFYDDSEYYTNIISKHNLSEFVIIRNEYIPHDEVSYYFSATDIVTQTYHSATQSGITQIAFHFNTPMLVTNVGGLAEIVIHNQMGYVCEQNPQEIAKCIVDFYTNNRKDSFSTKVEEEKEKYSWEKFVEKLV